MAIPKSHTKESLSGAFVRAIVAKAGQALTIKNESDYGVDGVIHRIEAINGKYQETGPLFNFQLKATVTQKIRENEISYSIEADAYNKCVHWDGLLPMVLVVYCMPRDEALWCCLTEESLTLKNCAYWKFMKVDTVIKSKKVILIPRNQIFDESAISHILDLAKKAARGPVNFD